jgi:hypothetical protein
MEMRLFYTGDDNYPVVGVLDEAKPNPRRAFHMLTTAFSTRPNPASP